MNPLIPFLLHTHSLSFSLSLYFFILLFYIVLVLTTQQTRTSGYFSKQTPNYFPFTKRRAHRFLVAYITTVNDSVRIILAFPISGAPLSCDGRGQARQSRKRQGTQDTSRHSLHSRQGVAGASAWTASKTSISDVEGSRVFRGSPATRLLRTPLRARAL